MSRIAQFRTLSGGARFGSKRWDLATTPGLISRWGMNDTHSALFCSANDLPPPPRNGFAVLMLAPLQLAEIRFKKRDTRCLDWRWEDGVRS